MNYDEELRGGIRKCNDKHLYDGAIFNSCPYCRAKHSGVKSPSQLNLTEIMTKKGLTEEAEKLLKKSGAGK